MRYRPSHTYGIGMLIQHPTLFKYEIGTFNITCIVTAEQWNQNTYIIKNRRSSSTVIVDPGGDADLIAKHIRDIDAKVARVLLTHPHHDHVGAAAQVSEFFNVPCELHRKDARLLHHAPMYALIFANKQIPPVARFELFEELHNPTEEPALRSIHTPGHTKGSTCYLFDGFVMTGDTLLRRRVGRTDFPGGSAVVIAESVSRLLTQLKDKIFIFPGHGKPWTIGEARGWWRDENTSPPEYRDCAHL